MVLLSNDCLWLARRTCNARTNMHTCSSFSSLTQLLALAAYFHVTLLQMTSTWSAPARRTSKPHSARSAPTTLFLPFTTTMDAPGGDSGNTHLTWGNVGLGFAFIAFDAVVSQVFGLGVGTPLVISAIRCIVQLGVMALVLQKIFEANNPWGVAGIASESQTVHC